MLRTSLFVASITSALVTTVSIADNSGKGHFEFRPLAESADSENWDPAAPWRLPKGYTQNVVSDESALNIYDGGRNDWHDMNTVNESGPMAGRYMYRTHEVRGFPEGGAISVVDIKTGETKILAQDTSWNALDGIRWTPWGTILFAEEVDGGRLFEITLDPSDLTHALSVDERPQIGLMAHEGIEVSRDGAIYIVDEHRGQTSGCTLGTPCGGSIFKFVPNVYGDLSAGLLYALKVSGPDGVGQAEWVGPVNANNARESSKVLGATSYQRPEDLEIIGNTLYVAITEGPRAQGVGTEVYDGRVIAIDLETLSAVNFVKPGLNVPVEMGTPGTETYQTGFDNVDNLAESPDGRLVLIEDNVPSDIWFASTRDVNEFGASEDVELFASLSDPSAEGTGIYFSPTDPRTLFVNVQHSASPDGDGTWAIRKKGKK